VQPSNAYSQLLGYRQVTYNANKQEQFTPCRREPSELLALALNILPVFNKRNSVKYQIHETLLFKWV